MDDFSGIIYKNNTRMCYCTPKNTHWFNKYLLSTYYVPAAVLGSRSIKVNGKIIDSRTEIAFNKDVTKL